MNENDKSVKDTMEIIINAGDARELISEALDNVADFDYQSAEENMEKAKEKLVIAHRLQTAKIQQEAEGKKVEYSVLFTHAQDTLMTINSEYKLTVHLIKVFKKRDEKEKHND
ncbi:PTS lactose/cellobiose transporter subunit IIA [Lactobacillus isalae]|uniref:PTS lactose/cellobiose transporter subunit IIA n=1 Tax=Lactobacillus isalae TaxID=2993455 RepID=UPI0024A93DA9|nr:PTS lactose/cellobiose transporter subunit IIA [Lactobacillus isalae]